MSSLLSKSLPKVSREFALDLRNRFRPIPLKAGMDRDLIMISLGEQRVIEFILKVSSNSIVSSNVEDIKPEPIKEDTDNTVAIPVIEVLQEEKSKEVGNWFKRFTTRTAT